LCKRRRKNVATGDCESVDAEFKLQRNSTQRRRIRVLLPGEDRQHRQTRGTGPATSLDSIAADHKWRELAQKVQNVVTDSTAKCFRIRACIWRCLTTLNPPQKKPTCDASQVGFQSGGGGNRTPKRQRLNPHVGNRLGKEVSRRQHIVSKTQTVNVSACQRLTGVCGC
jgi:hypothetical protein